MAGQARDGDIATGRTGQATRPRGCTCCARLCAVRQGDATRRRVGPSGTGLARNWVLETPTCDVFANLSSGPREPTQE